MERYQAVVVGAGPGGLAASYELKRRGISHVVLERGERVGWSWNNLYESLTLHTGKHMSTLPGMKFPRSAPLFVPRALFCEYLDRYAARNSLPVELGAGVTSVERSNGDWLVRTGDGEVKGANVVVATGIIPNPVIPDIPGRERFRGRVMHSVEYRRPDGFVGRRVLVVGVGNSGGEIGSELARAGAQVTMAVRSGANVVPLTMLGLPIQYISVMIRKLPRSAQEQIVAVVQRLMEARRGPPVLPRPSYSPLDAVPLIGFHLVDAIREGLIQVRGGIEELTEQGARFTDDSEDVFDDIILATGFRSALGFLNGQVRVDEKGFALRTDRVTSADQPGLFFTGQMYDGTGALLHICRDAAEIAQRVA